MKKIFLISLGIVALVNLAVISKVIIAYRKGRFK